MVNPDQGFPFLHRRRLFPPFFQFLAGVSDRVSLRPKVRKPTITSGAPSATTEGTPGTASGLVTATTITATMVTGLAISLPDNDHNRSSGGGGGATTTTSSTTTTTIATTTTTIATTTTTLRKKPKPTPRLLGLHVYFANWSAVLTNHYKGLLNALAAEIVADHTTHVVITGYASFVGIPGINGPLSLLRAQTVKNYLETALKARGYSSISFTISGNGVLRAYPNLALDRVVVITG